MRIVNHLWQATGKKVDRIGRPAIQQSSGSDVHVGHFSRSLQSNHNNITRNASFPCLTEDLDNRLSTSRSTSRTHSHAGRCSFWKLESSKSNDRRKRKGKEKAHLRIPTIQFLSLISVRNIFLSPIPLSGDTWLTQSLKDMSLVSKEDMLHCLHFTYLIPGQLRPLYYTHYVHSCRSTLLHHIRGQILYLASFSNRKFLEIFVFLTF